MQLLSTPPRKNRGRREARICMPLGCHPLFQWPKIEDIGS